tara:strand:+ start:6295 stop:7710 length:1416 start_codon:yes stop_codon:yes gene_type:complete
MQEQMYFPEGGVGSFLTSNMDEMPDNVIAFGQPRGINSMGEVANRMAQMGRNGDTELAHLRRDEVVMTEDMARDPRIRNAMAEVFSDNDMDMSRYTVGNAANSVNPYTGQREFFLKKIISGVKKIIKMAAPIVIPLALNTFFPGMGAVASGFIGSGISSLAQGNSFKDSMKAGVMGGITGGILKGMSNFAGGSRGKDLLEGLGPDKAKGGFFEFKNPYKKPEKVEAGKSTSGEYFEDPGASQETSLTATESAAVGPKAPITGIQGNIKLEDFTKEGNFFKKDYIDYDSAMEYLTKKTGVTPTESAIKSVMDQATGGYKILPTTVAGLGVAAAGGLMDPLPAEKIEDPYASESPSELLYAANPDEYRTGPYGPPTYRTLSDIMVPSDREPLYQQYIDPVTAANGGEMQNFPRRTGYIGGPGTETSDSIPAMLSDGEFVMNARAVRGAGGGSRERGVRKMYDMMRAFEGGAVA